MDPLDYLGAIFQPYIQEEIAKIRNNCTIETLQQQSPCECCFLIRFQNHGV